MTPPDERTIDLGGVERAYVRRDADLLYRELARLYPDDPLLDALPALVRFALTGEAMPRLGGMAAPFVSSIGACRNFWLGDDPRARLHHRIGRRTIGQDLDFLGEAVTAGEWGVARALNLAVLNQIRPTRRAAVVGTMRDDGIYALEWIAHYLTLGFAGIAIYTNDNADGSEQLLRCLADHGVITLVESQTSGTVRPEVKAFEHATHLLHELRDFEWVLFVDSDEFLQLGPHYHNAIPEVLDAVAALPDGLRPSAILYEWLWFNSGMIFAREPGLLMERFRYASPHWITKTMVRLRDLISMRRQHVPELRPGCTAVNSALQAADPERAHERHEPHYGGGRINHYWPKSFEEFSLKKARGDTLHLSDPECRAEYHREFRRFFQWNAPDTPDTRQPSDAAFLGAVKRTMQRLRALRGVADLEEEVQSRFSTLVARYDSAGGLRAIYRQLQAEDIETSLPTD